MKFNLLLLAFIFNIFSSVYAQSDFGVYEKENWLEYWTEFDPKNKDYKEPKKIVAGYITENTTWRSKDTHLLQGVVYVINNAVLTIEQGTVIRGDYNTCGTLVITKGAKLIAEGSEGFPIVFTSNKESFVRKPGDWGGLIIMGDAPINNFGGVGMLDFNLDPAYNRYGGENKESSSGIIKYVRVEYAGRKLSSKKELNGISFAGVGSGTKIQNVQVSYSNDDSFEFYGGNVKLEKLLSYRASDDDFDFTQGVQANLSNSIALRNPHSFDDDRSRCLEINSYDAIEKCDPLRNKTNVAITNVTFINNEDNNQGLIKEAIFVANESYLSFKNSVVYGFKDFLMVKDFPTSLEGFEEYIKLQNLVVAHCGNAFISTKKDGMVEMDTNYMMAIRNIKQSDGTIGDYFMNSDISETPDFRYLKLERNNKILVNK